MKNDILSLYDLHYESLYRFLLCYTSDSQLIEDVIQEIFMKLWKEKESLSVVQMKPYLFCSARNRLLNYLRDRKTHNLLLDKWFKLQTQPEYDYNIDELFKRLEQAIESLPGKCRDIFVMSKLEGYSYSQIAEIKNLSVKTVENQMGIALKKIRTFFHEK